jgi:predicted  nucleic acid-binding Zn-ribbon protein
VTTNTWQLYKLQQVDTQIREVLKQKESLDDGSSASREAEEAGTALEETLEKIKKNNSSLKQMELEVKGYEARIKELQEKLYAGKVLNPKELGGWQTEIKQFAGKKDALEEKMLILMEENDSLDSSVEGLKSRHAQKQSILEQARKDYQAELSRLEETLAGLTERRESQTGEIDAEYLKKYEILRQQKNGLAVARIQKGNCGACFMSIPEFILKKVQTRQIEYCNTCGRILFSDSE